MRKTMNARAYRALLMPPSKKARTDRGGICKSGENLPNSVASNSREFNCKDVLQVGDGYLVQTEKFRGNNQAEVDAGGCSLDTKVHEGTSTNVRENEGTHFKDKKYSDDEATESKSAIYQIVRNCNECSLQSSQGPAVIKDSERDACIGERCCLVEKNAPEAIEEASTLETSSSLPFIFMNELADTHVSCSERKREASYMNNVDHVETLSLAEMHLKSESEDGKVPFVSKLQMPKPNKPEKQSLILEKLGSGGEFLNENITESDLEEGEIKLTSNIFGSPEQQQIFRKLDHGASLVVNVAMLNRSADTTEDEILTSQIRLIQETSAMRKKDLLQKQTIEHEEFKSFMESEKLKIEKAHALKLYPTNSGKDDNQCVPSRNSSCKMDGFDQYLKSQRRKLIVAQIDARNKEKELKDKWMKDAHAGKQVKCFDTIPLSSSGFKLEYFREPYCRCETHDFSGNATESVHCSDQQSNANNASNNIPDSVPKEATMGSELLTVSINVASNNIPESVPKEASLGSEILVVSRNTAMDEYHRKKIQPENIVAAPSEKQNIASFGLESPSKLTYTGYGCNSSAPHQEPSMDYKEPAFFDGVGSEGQRLLSQVVAPKEQHTGSSNIVINTLQSPVALLSFAHQRPAMLERDGNEQLLESNSLAVVHKPQSVESIPSGVESSEELVAPHVTMVPSFQPAHALPVNEHETNVIPDCMINKEARSWFQPVSEQLADSVLSVKHDGASTSNMSVTAQIPNFIQLGKSTLEHKRLTVSDGSGGSVPSTGLGWLSMSGGVASQEVSKSAMAQRSTEADCCDVHETCIVTDRVIEKMDAVPVTEQEKFLVSNAMGSEHITKSIQPVVSMQHSDGIISFVKPISLYSLPSADTRDTVDCESNPVSARKETDNITQPKSTQFLPFNDGSTFLNPTPSRSASLAVMSFENGQTSSPQNEGSNCSRIIVPEPHSMENASIQDQISSSTIDTVLDSTQVWSSLHTALLVEQGQTSPVSERKEEQTSHSEIFNCIDHFNSSSYNQNGDNSTLQEGLLDQLKSSTVLDPTQVRSSLYTTFLVEEGQASPLGTMKDEQISHIEMFKNTGHSSSSAFKQNGDDTLHEGLLSQICSSKGLDPTQVWTSLHTGLSVERGQTNLVSAMEVEQISNTEMFNSTEHFSSVAYNQNRESILQVGPLDRINSSTFLDPSQVWTSLDITLPVERGQTNLISSMEDAHTEMVNSTVHCSSSMYNQNGDSTLQEGLLDQHVSQAVSRQQEPHTSTNAERTLDDLRCTGILQERSIHLTESVAITANLLTNGLDPDPLQNELLKIRKEEDLIIEMHDKVKMLINSAREKEIEKLRKKYDTLLQDSEAAYMAKKKALDLIYNKVSMNHILAGNYIINFFDNNAAASQDGLVGFTAPVLQAMQPQCTQRTTAASGITSLPNVFFRPPIATLPGTDAASLPSQAQHSVSIPSSLASVRSFQEVQPTSEVLSSNRGRPEFSSMLSSDLMPVSGTTSLTGVHRAAVTSLPDNCAATSNSSQAIVSTTTPASTPSQLPTSAVFSSKPGRPCLSSLLSPNPASSLGMSSSPADVLSSHIAYLPNHHVAPSSSWTQSKRVAPSSSQNHTMIAAPSCSRTETTVSSPPSSRIQTMIAASSSGRAQTPFVAPWPSSTSALAQFIQEVRLSTATSPSTLGRPTFSTVSTSSSSRTVSTVALPSCSRTQTMVATCSSSPSLTTVPAPFSSSSSTRFIPEIQLSSVISSSILGQPSFSSVLVPNLASAGSMRRSPAPHLRGFTLPMSMQARNLSSQSGMVMPNQQQSSSSDSLLSSIPSTDCNK